ncbi:hypothetical protein ACQSED_27425 [Salmonella enterica]|uniref:hypothetical protein n=1 Tax=Salmonella enterica TaxID=28901 RepID=UPI003D31C45C
MEKPINTQKYLRHNLLRKYILQPVMTAPDTQRQNNPHQPVRIGYLRQYPVTLYTQYCASFWPFVFWPFPGWRCYPWLPLTLMALWPFSLSGAVSLS